MPLDYSKWDALELSDDSDIEVHPNVDKRSFIRAKQNQIHAEREQRRHHIATLKYERLVNDGLMKRISDLLAALKAHADDAPSSSISPAQHAAQTAFRAVMESAPKDPTQDAPPPRPEGVHQNAEPLPTYSKMMASVLDQVNKALDERKVEPEDRYAAMVEEIGGHLKKVQDLQAELLQKLGELEKEEKGKITSESYHTGFDSSFVNKNAKSSETKTAGGDKEKGTAPELLNPNYSQPSTSGTAKAGKDNADDDDDDEPVEASPAARKFAQIPVGDYRASFEFLKTHPEILVEKETDGLLVAAFDAGLEGDEKSSRQCVHQALLLQYCRALGRDGVALFFKRISTKGQAHDVFFQDVQDTYAKIRTRTREIARQRQEEGDKGGVEQIQLHAVEPGTVINITIPEEGSEDEGMRQARAIYDGFKPELKKALETGSLDEVNKVLGDMKVEEAEEVVGLLGEAGCLSVEEQIIDTTTEEGRKKLEEMERTEQVQNQATATQQGVSTEQYPDPE